MLHLKYVPEKLKTIEMCDIAVWSLITAFKYVTDEYRASEEYERAVAHYGEDMNWLIP
jgi:hypothetical protein